MIQQLQLLIMSSSFDFYTLIQDYKDCFDVVITEKMIKAKQNKEK
jgi:hypothetical protein